MSRMYSYLMGEADVVKKNLHKDVDKYILEHKSVDNQNLDEITATYRKINEAILQVENGKPIIINGKSFFSGETGILINPITYFYNNLVLPELFKVKKNVLTRLETLKYDEAIKEINKIPNKSLKEQIEYVHLLREEQLQVDKKKDEFDNKEKELKLSMEISERKAKLLLSFIQKESVATIIGALLLIIMVTAQLIAMFSEIKDRKSVV